MMDPDAEPPLDISEFQCTVSSDSRVAVVFIQTDRRYAYVWQDSVMGLSEPTIVGSVGPHAPEVLDCLARAVAYQAARERFNPTMRTVRVDPASIAPPRPSRFMGLFNRFG